MWIFLLKFSTDKYKKYSSYKDPMTGSSIDFLEQEYLKSKGYDGKEPLYSRNIDTRDEPFCFIFLWEEN